MIQEQKSNLLKKIAAVVLLAAIITGGSYGYQEYQLRAPKYKAGDCLLEPLQEPAVAVYQVQSVEGSLLNKTYKVQGMIYIVLGPGMALPAQQIEGDAPVRELQLAQQVSGFPKHVNCETGEEIK